MGRVSFSISFVFVKAVTRVIWCVVGRLNWAGMWHVHSRSRCACMYLAAKACGQRQRRIPLPLSTTHPTPPYTHSSSVLHLPDQTPVLFYLCSFSFPAAIDSNFTVGSLTFSATFTMTTPNTSAPPSPLLPPSPPATPPRVAFNPPLYLQRRTAVQAILRNLSRSPRFNGKLRSLLDVGCGPDCFLLRTLIPCEDDLPLEKITGIDFDEDLFSPDVADSLAPGAYGGKGDAEDRWRGLYVSLLQGV